MHAQSLGVWSRRFTRAAAADATSLIDDRAILALECAAIFVALPVALALGVLDVPFVIPLGIATLACVTWLLQRHVPLMLRATRRDVRRVVARFAIASTLLVATLLLFAPEQLAFFPRAHPWKWLILAIVYPIASVWPQELLYRSFFFERYEPLFGRALPIASALAFAFMHILYRNPTAVLLTLAGGLWFSSTYDRTRSLPLVWLEHTLFGLLVFTIGLGDSFHSSRFW